MIKKKAAKKPSRKTTPKNQVAVIGIGRVGLPFALFLADCGYQVVGIDRDPEYLKKLSKGKFPFKEENGDRYLKKHFGKKFTVTDSIEAIRDVSTIIFTVGTPVDEHLNPVFASLEEVVRSLFPYLKKGQLLIFRSTLSPGTTEYLTRLIEKETKFKIGRDLFLSFCPERIAEGYAFKEIPEVPQIIGADDDKSRQKALTFFKKVNKTRLPTDARSAELSKLFCNMYRYIDFAISNEFMMIAGQYERDIHSIVELVNFGYKRKGLKSPGLASGPCLYKDGFFLINQVPFPELISTAWKIHEAVPYYLINQVKAKKKLEGKTVAILGLAFKKDSDDTRNSLAYKFKKILEIEADSVLLHDPHVAPGKLEPILKKADAVFVTVNHSAYARIGWPKFQKMLKKKAVVCDIWNVFETGKVILEV